ncbi:sensor histidine kinase [Paenibacillus daejeonensis]|uniref:sensor histidine kinase n=1 Tax=Paenibacillus daejeonensis TaxID=135193 RepID=UPI00037DD2DD|nr:sensor histidine kinase [Paenibacillus daejeonensis]
MREIWRYLTGLRSSIRSKLMLAMILVASVPVAVVTGMAADTNRKSIEAEVVESNLTNMTWTRLYLSDQFVQLNNLMYSIMINQNLNDYLRYVDQAELSSQYTAQRNLLEGLTASYYSANKNVTAIELYLPDAQKRFVINSDGSNILPQTTSPPEYAELFESGEASVIMPLPGQPGQFKLIRSINRFETRQPYGGIAFTLKWSMLDQALELLNPGTRHTVLIANGSGEVLYHPDGQELSQRMITEAAARAGELGYGRIDGHYVFYDRVEPSDLIMLKLIPDAFINQSAWRTMTNGLIIGAISVIAAIVTAGILAWRLARPITRLARSMQVLNPMKDHPVVPSGRTDEIGLLETKFANLTSRIREHIKNEYSMKLEKQTAELKALQAQINPHFLQNTLQLIGSTLFRSTPAESYAIIRALSQMFRYIIREPNDLATIKEEVEHLRHYLYIQQWRYESRLNSSLHVDDAALACKLPRLTLQPLVENAFVHGLEQQAGSWNLDIRVLYQYPDVLIEVCDNGAGMTESRRSEVLNRMDASHEQMWSTNGRIGLSNVASRLRLHFGDDNRLSIKSRPGAGTTISFRIPAHEEEGEHG